jgi:hypothetical protein
MAMAENSAHLPRREIENFAAIAIVDIRAFSPHYSLISEIPSIAENPVTAFIVFHRLPLLTAPEKNPLPDTVKQQLEASTMLDERN